MKQLYSDLNPDPNPVQKAAMKAGQHDTAIGLLEEDVVCGRQTVRKALVDILTPDLITPNATATHQALLTLGKTRDNRTRLITQVVASPFFPNSVLIAGPPSTATISNGTVVIRCMQAGLLPQPASRITYRASRESLTIPNDHKML